MISSSKTAFPASIQNILMLKEREYAVVKRDVSPTGDHLEVFALDQTKVTPEIEQLCQSLHQLDKGSYPTFMLKEILEQPEALRRLMTGRVREGSDDIVLGGLQLLWEGKAVIDHFAEATRIVIIACGSSNHAGLVGKCVLIATFIEPEQSFLKS